MRLRIWRLLTIMAAMASLTPQTLPADWTSLRNQWEYTHAGRAVLQIAALAFLVCSVLVESEQGDRYG